MHRARHAKLQQMMQYPNSPETHRPPSRSFRQKAAGAAFVTVGVLPTLFFLWVSLFPFTDGSPGSAEEVPLTVNDWLMIGFGIVMVLLIGALCGVLTWAAAGVQDSGKRIGLTTLMLLVAAGAGVMAGLVGGLVIALVRYPVEMEDH